MTKDVYGRPTLNLRIAVTQQCNLECLYCHREGHLNSSEFMTPEEITTIASISAEFGIRKLKITGGEPLMRSDINVIVEKLREIHGIEEISMVTNGRLLTHDKAVELKRSGLSRININLPSMKEDVYERVTGSSLDEATAGIGYAKRAGLDPVKINTVVIRRLNDSDIDELILYSKKLGVTLQLIELEPIGIDECKYADYHVPLDPIEKNIARVAKSVTTRRYMHARRVYTLDENVKIEFVRPIENTVFCMHCTRIRLTSDGMLKPCLMRNDNLVDILRPLRRHASRNELCQIFSEAIGLREPFWKPAQLVNRVQAMK